MEVIVGPDGRARFIYSDDLAAVTKELGKATTRRASHVEPSDGGWTADLAPVGGPVLGPYVTRQEALDREVEWLREHGIPICEPCRETT